MGCRTRVMANRYDPDREITFGRGNLSALRPSTCRASAIKAPRRHGLVLRRARRQDRPRVIDQLLDRFEIQSHEERAATTPSSWDRACGWIRISWVPTTTVGEVLKHGTLTVGFIGLAECLKALIGEHHGESPKKLRNSGLDIVGTMRERMRRQAARRPASTSPSSPRRPRASPAASSASTSKRFGNIPGVTDRDYYTNSFHIPVYFPINAFDKIQPGGALPRPDQRRPHQLCGTGRRSAQQP